MLTVTELIASSLEPSTTLAQSPLSNCRYRCHDPFSFALSPRCSRSGGSVSAHRNDWMRARLACAEVGIDPGSAAFGQCVFDLYYSLWDEQNEAKR